MNTHSSNDDIYIGRHAGEDILNEIKNAKKSVKIVSPYLTGSFVQEIINLHNKGIQITLITADNITEEKNSYSNFNNMNLVKTEKIVDEKLEKVRKNGIYYSKIAFALSIVSFALFFVFQVFIILTALLFLAGIIIYIYFSMIETSKIIYAPLFRIKVFDSKSGDKPYSTQLIHSKIFVIDDKVCFLGSANFTYSGFKTHYETVICINDVKAVRDISHEVEMLYNSNELRSKPVEEWAKNNGNNEW